MSQTPNLCRVCQSGFGRTFQREGTPYGVCATCKCINKVLTEREYFDLGATYDPGQVMSVEDERLVREYLSVDEHKALLQSILPRLHLAGRAPQLLDVGCGMGGYLLAGRELGFEVQGVEPSQSHSEIGRTAFNLPIVTDYFGRGLFGDRRFDIVILSHVIEHIYDPKTFLDDVAEIVAPGGVIMLRTPNAQSNLAALTGSRWSMLVPLDHVTMMAPESLRRLTPAGFGLTLETQEQVWEPAVVILQALKGVLTKRAQSSTSAAAAAPDGATRNSFRSTYVKINGNPLVKLLLSLASLPIWTVDQGLGRGHCLQAIYQRQ
ncbi:MAG: class I SAM-dependent methyltransferase [Pseudomonadota bacterium]